MESGGSMEDLRKTIEEKQAWIDGYLIERASFIAEGEELAAELERERDRRQRVESRNASFSAVLQRFSDKNNWDVDGKRIYWDGRPAVPWQLAADVLIEPREPNVSLPRELGEG